MVVEDIIVKIRTEVKELKGLVNLRQDLQKLKRVGGATNKQIGAIDKRLGQVNKAGKGVANVMGQFKFELLGILFFGMAVNRFLSGLLKPALEVTGVFEIMNDTLALFFLPTAEKVSNILLDISEKLGELSPTTQEFVGDLVLLLSAMFLGLFIFATFGLGLASIEAAFGLTTAAALLLFGKIILISAAIIFLILLFKNWKNINTDVKVGMGASGIVAGLLLLQINPLIGGIVLLISALILLKTGFDELKKSYGAGFFDSFIEGLNRTIRAWNSLPAFLRFMLGGATGLQIIPEIPLGGRSITGGPITGAFAGGAFAHLTPGGALPPPRATSTDISSNVDINIGGIIDVNSLFDQVMPEIQRRINETAENFTHQLDRSRTS